MSGRIRIVISVLVALWTGTASAQPPPSDDADRAAAEQLFIEARQLMQSGKYAPACRKLKASFDLDPATGTQLNLADCYVKIGRLASAWGHYRDAAVRADQENRQDRVRYARTQAAALEPRLPRLRIDMNSAAEVPGLVIKRDGQVVPLELLGSSVYVDPGEHEITALAPRFSLRTIKVEAREGKVSTVEIPPLPVASTSDQGARGQGGDSSTTLQAWGSRPEGPGGSVTAERGLGFTVSAGLGPKTARGDLLAGTIEGDATGGAFLLGVDLPFSRYLGLRAGAGYVNKGVLYSAIDDYGALETFEGSTHYLQLPVKARIEVPFEKERLTIRPRIEAGLGANLLVSRGGTYSSDGSSIELWDSWFHGHHTFNLSLLLGGGVDVGLGRNPDFLFGVDVIRDAHLLPEWDASSHDENYKYQAWYIGGHVTFQLYRRGDEDTAEEQAAARQRPHRRGALSRLQNAWRTD